MIDSNFSILLHYKLPAQEQNKRLAQLEQSMKQLQAYKIKARPAKRTTIEKLIIAYEKLLENKRSIK